MNPNLILGVISFLIWSTFSSWYYVSYVKTFDEPTVQPEIIEPAEEPDPIPVEEPSPVSETEATSEPEPLAQLVRIESTLVFDLNAERTNGTDVIDQIIDSLNMLPEQRSIDITINGFTCDLGTQAYNQELGQKRADIIASYFRQSIERQITIQASSQGENNPAVPNDSEENRSKNRRVTITIISQP